jgi:hypothetical protein
MGLGWDFLKKTAAKIIGEENVERLEWVVEQLQTLIEGGWQALFDKIKDGLSGLKEQLFAKIQEFLVVSVIKKAIVKIASMFSPVGAVVQLVLTIWDVVQTLKEQFSHIMGVVTSVVDALDLIVKGTLDPAKEKVEEVLAGGLRLAIALLAKLVGLGGMGKKVEEFIESIRDRIEKAVVKLIKKLKKKLKSLFGKGKKGEKSDEEKQEERPSDSEFEALYSEKIEIDAPDGTHHLWLEPSGGKLTPMVASKKSPVEEFLERARGVGSAEDDAKVPQESIDKAERELGKLDRAATRASSQQTADSQSNSKDIAHDFDEVIKNERDLAEDLERVFSAVNFGIASETAEERVETFAQASQFAPRTFDPAVFQATGEDPESYEFSSHDPFQRKDYVKFHVSTRPDGLDEDVISNHWDRRDRPHLLDNQIRGAFYGARVNHASAQRYAFIKENVDIVMYVGEKAATAVLREALGGRDVFDFLQKLVEGDTIGEVDAEKFVGLMKDETRGAKNRKFIGDKIRGKARGNHEWIPVSIVGEVVEHAASLEKTAGRAWIKAMDAYRTPTDLIVVTVFEEENVEVVRYLTEGEGDKPTPTSVTLTEETDEKKKEKRDERFGGAGTHPGSVIQRLVAEVDTKVEPFHEVLRVRFRQQVADIVDASPGVFLKAVKGDLDTLLWGGEGAKGRKDVFVSGATVEELKANSKVLRDALESMEETPEGEITLDALGRVAETLKAAVKEQLEELRDIDLI